MKLLFSTELCLGINYLKHVFFCVKILSYIYRFSHISFFSNNRWRIHSPHSARFNKFSITNYLTELDLWLMIPVCLKRILAIFTDWVSCASPKNLLSDWECVTSSNRDQQSVATNYHFISGRRPVLGQPGKRVNRLYREPVNVCLAQSANPSHDFFVPRNLQ